MTSDDVLRLSDLLEECSTSVSAVSGNRLMLSVIARPDYIRLLNSLIIEGVELWDESVLTG